MKILRELLAMSGFAKEKITDIRKRRLPTLPHRLWSLIVGVLLIFFAFPPLAQACETFRLQIFGPEMARPGDLIVYTVKYQNLDWPLLTDVTLIGQISEYASFVSASPDCQWSEDTLVCHIGTLKRGDGGQVEMTLRVNDDAPPEAVVEVEMLAVGRKPCHGLMFLNDARLCTEIVVPQLTITKHPSADIIYAGEPVTYTYVVTNTGDIALTEVTLVDDQKSPPQVCAPVPHLEPGGAFTCTWTTPLDDDTTNVATVTSLDPWSDPVTATASAFVNTLQPPDPGGGGIITLEKVASAETVYIGETVVYTYTVSNPSDDPVLDISLTDDQLGVIADSFGLEAGESITFVISTVMMTDTTNVATAVGINLLGDEVRVQASEFVGVVAPDVALSLSLTASASRVYAGDVVTYTYIVTNTGLGVAYDVVLSDDPAGTIDGPFDLAGGASRTYVVSRVLDEDTTNVATAIGVDGLGKPLVATASVFVDTIQRPGPNGEGILSLTVTPSAMTVEAGTVVTYTYVVTNLSQDPVSNIVLMDDQFGFIAPQGEMHTFDVYEGFTLLGGESRTLIIAVPLYQTTRNVAVATGQDLLLTVVSAEATALVEVFSVEPPPRYTIFLPIVCNNSS